MSENIFNVGDYVLLHTDDDWNGHYGMIDKIDNNIIEVFYILLPGHRYLINPEFANRILETIESRNRL